MKKHKLGFTLIELLVVIALIGILAVAVLSALNPIEQVNKARDARTRADSSQLLKAIDRYYAANVNFPWVYYDDIASDDSAFVGYASYVGVGVCGNTDGTEDASEADGSQGEFNDTNGCSNDGFLIETDELKNQFMRRPSVQSDATTQERLIVFKPANNPSVSVCFIPSSSATKDTAGTDTTALQVFSGWGSGSLPAATNRLVRCDSTSVPADLDWGTVNMYDKCYFCVPEE